MRIFCENNQLMGLKVDNLDRFIRALDSELDLGALFLCEVEGEDNQVKLRRLIRAISGMRPELPIFLRRLKPLAEGEEDPWAEKVAGCYLAGDNETVRELIDTYIFNRYYPSEVIRQIQIDTERALENLFCWLYGGNGLSSLNP